VDLNPLGGGGSSGGLAFYRVIVRLSYVTSQPDRRLHGRHLVCTASTTGFDDVTATSSILVRCKTPLQCALDVAKSA